MEKLRPFNEWTQYASDYEIVFYTDAQSKVHKGAEWRLVSNTEMHYTAFNRDGSINTHHVYTGEDVLDIWEKYHRPAKCDLVESERIHILRLAKTVRECIKSHQKETPARKNEIYRNLRRTAERYLANHANTPHLAELQELLVAYNDIPN